MAQIQNESDETKKPLPMPRRLARMLWAIEIQQDVNNGNDVGDREAIWVENSERYIDTANKLLFRLKRNDLEICEVS